VLSRPAPPRLNHRLLGLRLMPGLRRLQGRIPAFLERRRHPQPASASARPANSGAPSTPPALSSDWPAAAADAPALPATSISAPPSPPLSDLEEDRLAPSAHRTAQSRLARQIMLSATLTSRALTIAPKD
jgi:hypothetical protein